MIELPLIFLGGILGSGHCVGMCGGFAMAIGWQSPTMRRNLVRQLCYSFGRITTYTFLGAIAGFTGQRLTANLSTFTGMPSVLSVVAGVFLVVQSLIGLGWWPRRWSLPVAPTTCPGASQFRMLISSRTLTSVLLAGLVTGFLPCGLVYAFLALAVSSESVLDGAAVMFTLGLGTIPLMVLTGAGGSLVKVEARKRLVWLAACCVLVTGGLTVTRGAASLLVPAGQTEPACPFCSDPEQPVLKILSNRHDD